MVGEGGGGIGGGVGMGGGSRPPLQAAVYTGPVTVKSRDASNRNPPCTGVTEGDYHVTAFRNYQGRLKQNEIAIHLYIFLL